MNTSEQIEHRELQPAKIVQMDTLPEEHIENALRMFSKMRDSAKVNPDTELSQWWLEYDQTKDCPDSTGILCLWVCGAVRVVLRIDHETKEVRSFARLVIQSR